jgi:NAD-dependent dihydropyrimidine dehydrogenase PreA subunit
MAEIDLESFNFTEFIKDTGIFIDKDKCNGCGLCGEVCPFGLPHSNGMGKFKIIKPESCTQCSACKRNCPTQAIILQEQAGCGCLWNARGVAKNAKNAPKTQTCCGTESIETSNSNSSCCGS